MSYALVSTILSTTASKSITVAAGQQLIIQAVDGASATTTLTLTDSQGTPNTYVKRGLQTDTRNGFQAVWFDCLSPAAGTYNIELVGATQPQFVIRLVTGLNIFAGTFESADFGATVPSTTDGVTTAAITPGSSPAVVMGMAFGSQGAGTLVIAAGTGFGNFFQTTTGLAQVAEDQAVGAGSQIASFTAGAGQEDVIVMGAAYAVVPPPGTFIGQAPWALIRNTQTPTTGFSIAAAAGLTQLVLLPAGTLAAGTITLPPNPSDNQPFMAMTSQTVTALTVNTSDGTTISVAPTTLSNTSAIKLRFQEASNSWLREQ